ncbi:non-ribosomal peptide synthetase [Pseudomonas sp. Hp2]|uniref:non-ribosomal peptide synthetase n=1 Tax=Pseudomonas sp. Hp2 TaxID=701189 RepID=UPI00112E0966|nr:non-ribosomal peptide synthetase [Pseudomonas sp. Hp2]
MNGVHRASLPLTTAQRGLWVGQKINPATSLKMAEALELLGPIDPELLLRASHRVADEFDNIRVRIVEEQGVPRQIVDPEYLHTFPYFDLSTEPRPRAAAERWIAGELERADDLRNGPLWTCALFRLGDEHYLWVQIVNHLVVDGYAGGMVAQRLAEVYSALVADAEPPPCTALPMAGLVELEEAYRASDRNRRDREYWLKQLADPPPAVTLARRQDFTKGGLLRGTGHLSSDQVERLRELGRAHGASLPQVLIALVGAYYHRLTGAEDLIFGMPVTGRVNAQYRNTPGMVANAVFIRLAMRADEPFHALFGQVASVVRQSLRHQQYRYEDIRRDLGLVGYDQQLARLAVNVEAFDYALDFGGARAIPHNLSNGSAEDLTIFFYERGNGEPLRFDLDANPALYERAEIDAHCDRLVRLADAVLQDAGQPLGSIDLLGEDERSLLLHDWNDTAAALPEPATLLHLFERQVAADPESIAVQHGERTLGRRALYERSGRLAAQWMEDGVQPGDVVAVMLPRGESLLVALLAVMWTGAAYLPLDPDGPVERNRRMLADAGAIAVVCEPALSERYAQGGVEWLDLRSDAEEIAPLRADPDGVAYVLYTSGSTGTPKGVEVGHRALANFLLSMREDLALDADDRVLALTTITFDIAGLELYLPLLTAARTVIAQAALAHDPRALARLLASERISLVQATPSLWRILLANEDAELGAVHALVGGEALSGELATRLLQRAARVTQLYGPTETTIWSTIMPLQAIDAALPPIGRPLRNTWLYVLDAGGRLLPPGAVGELYIGGEGVAHGYRRRPELTQARFLPDPFRGEGRMYRTGDLVRWREDGVLEFVGRADAQLKIRGHRVEPGEVESVLLRHPQLAAALVVGHGDGQGAQQLVAYVVGRDGLAPSAEALRAHLQGELPAYMVPSAFVPMPALPLTPNGKLDRKALPPPERSEVRSFVAPRDALERQLAELWQSLLGVERIGIHDNFFELGGDSLTAAELLAQFPNRFGVELPLGSLFHASTIAGLAAAMRRAEGPQGDPLAGVLKLREGEPGRTALFCIHPVVGLGWSYLTLLGSLDAHWPVYALQSPALRAVEALPERIEDIAADYLARIRGVQPRGPYRLLGWSLGGLIAHAIATLLRAEGEEVELLAMLDAYPHLEQAEALDESQRVQAAVRFLGLQPAPGQPVPATTAEMAALVCEHYGLLSLPLVRQLLEREPQLLDNIGTLTHRHLDLARRYRPARLDVDLLFVEAAVRPQIDLSAAMDYRPDAWRGHVRSLSSRAIDSDHQSMLGPQHAPAIAAFVREHLQRPRQDDRQAATAAVPAADEAIADVSYA